MFGALSLVVWNLGFVQWFVQCFLCFFFGCVEFRGSLVVCPMFLVLFLWLVFLWLCGI